MNRAERLAESGWIPDWLLREGIRRRLGQFLSAERRPVAEQELRLRAFIETLRNSPIAIETDAANRQHYEVPAEFFARVLGPRRKYSCCLWPDSVSSLAAAEDAMLRLTCERAGLEDGMRVLDLGCGWGSLTLWIAEHFPHTRIVSVSNSRSQKAAIEEQALRCGFSGLEVITADAAHFAPAGVFDRVISVEMFEHARNVEALLRRVASWLASHGRLFVHVFCHRELAYAFDAGPGDWMASEFFSGGMMPSANLYLEFQRDLVVEQRWFVGGAHYARTLHAWLDRLDEQRDDLFALFARTHSPAQAARQLQRWRMFLIGCEESFAYGGGEEWFVAHYRFAKR